MDRSAPPTDLPADAAAVAAIDAVFREHHARALASLIRALRDFDIAEDALQDAFATALVHWPREGQPANPCAWLILTARRKALDRLRRESTGVRKAQEAAVLAEIERSDGGTPVTTAFEDDRLRLIFTCCHPSLAPESRVALTLRTLCGLSTPEIARAFLVEEPALAQRIVRAKRKIRDAGIPYDVPGEAALPERLGSVLSVIYLVFNEGYAATTGAELVRRDLCNEAIRLARLLTTLMPDEPECFGLLALMLFHDSRRDTRTAPNGDVVLLEDQDRTRWDRPEIEEGVLALARAGRIELAGPYQLQAAIAAFHATSPSPVLTRWDEIAALYKRLNALSPSPVIELNHAVAVAMAEGPARGLLLIDALVIRGELERYHLLHAARADLLRRLNRLPEAADAYRLALTFATNEPDRRFLQSRLTQVTTPTSGD